MGGGTGSYTGAYEPRPIQDWATAVAGSEAPALALGGAAPLCPAYELYDEPRVAREFLRAHNVYRCTAGLGLLQWDSRAFATARRYALRAPTDRLQHSPEVQPKARVVPPTARMSPLASGFSPDTWYRAGTRRSAARRL